MDLLLVWYYGIIGCGLDDDDVRLVEEELKSPMDSRVPSSRVMKARRSDELIGVLGPFPLGLCTELVVSTREITMHVADFPKA